MVIVMVSWGEHPPFAPCHLASPDNDLDAFGKGDVGVRSCTTITQEKYTHILSSFSWSIPNNVLNLAGAVHDYWQDEGEDQKDTFCRLGYW